MLQYVQRMLQNKPFTYDSSDMFLIQVQQPLNMKKQDTKSGKKRVGLTQKTLTGNI